MTEGIERRAFQDLAQKTGAARQLWHCRMDLAFDELQQRDAELAVAAIQLCGDTCLAARVLFIWVQPFPAILRTTSVNAIPW